MKKDKLTPVMVHLIKRNNGKQDWVICDPGDWEKHFGIFSSKQEVIKYCEEHKLQVTVSRGISFWP